MSVTGETQLLEEKHYTASVVGELMSTTVWWNDTDLSHQQSVHHKPHMDWPGIKQRYPGCNASD
jgi:hypothetical protein